MPRPATASPPTDPAEMTLGDHLEELRRRLILAMIGILPILITALVLGKPLIALLIDPLRDELRAASQPSGLLATGPFETFAVYLQISIIATVIVGSPWILYQFWKFIEPGLYSNERSFVHILVPLSSILTLLSAAFLYFVVLPVILAFFISFGSQLGRSSTPIVEVDPAIVFPSTPYLAGDPPDPAPGDTWINTDLMQRRTAVPLPNGSLAVVGSELVAGAGITQQYRVSEYVKTVLNLALAFGIGFQTPVVVLLLGWAGIVERQTLGKYRRYAVAACTVAGALLTPADPLSMMLLAGPLYVLFELGMLLLRVFPPEHERRSRRENDEADGGPNRDSGRDLGREPDGDADDDLPEDPHTPLAGPRAPAPTATGFPIERTDDSDIFDESVTDSLPDDDRVDPNAYDDPPPPAEPDEPNEPNDPEKPGDSGDTPEPDGRA